MEGSQILKKINPKNLKKSIPLFFIIIILLVLFWLHSTGLESKITQVLNPIFNMVYFVFSQPFFTLPIMWMLPALIIFLLGLLALFLLLWPYILIGISSTAIIVKTLRNKRPERKRIIKIAWSIFFIYLFTLWFAMANNNLDWLPGKKNVEYVLYKKCNPWAEKYTPEAAKNSIGLQIIKGIETEYGLSITLSAAKEQNNLWSLVKVIWSGTKFFFMKGLF